MQTGEHLPLKHVDAFALFAECDINYISLTVLLLLASILHPYCRLEDNVGSLVRSQSIIRQNIGMKVSLQQWTSVGPTSHVCWDATCTSLLALVPTAGASIVARLIKEEIDNVAGVASM